MFYFRLIGYLVVFVGISNATAGAYEDFFAAVRGDNAGLVVGLLQRGFDPNSRDETGQAAITLAARQGSARVLETLLQHPQLDLNAKNQAGETALMMAALTGNLVVAKRLVERGAAVSQEGWSALHYAATGPEPRIVALLLERGASADARSPNGTTPLMMAAQYGAEESVALLLHQKADVRLRNQHGLMAGDFARLAGREALAKQLDALAR